MSVAPAPWQIGLARLEGAIPFLSPTVRAMLAGRALRRLWACHARDYPFESTGIHHDQDLAQHELMRTFKASERNDFLSWVGRRAPAALAETAQLALAAKSATETFSADFADADRALDRLDAHLPTRDPEETVVTFVNELILEEPAFLEGGTEPTLILGRAVDRPARAGAAWAASLALAMRPHLLGLGGGAYVFAGLAPRALFRPLRETPIPRLVRQSLAASIAAVAADVDVCVKAEKLGTEHLADRNASSRALGSWRFLIAMGPLTRAEMARGMRITKRTASQAALALEAAGLARQEGRYGALQLDRRYAGIST